MGDAHAVGGDAPAEGVAPAGDVAGPGGGAPTPGPAGARPRARRRRPGARRRLALATAGLVVALLLLAEGGLRLAGFPTGLLASTSALWAAPGQDVLGPFQPGARVTIAWPPEVAYTVTTSPLGLRGPAPRPGAPLVLCLGDSTTFGAGVADDATYPVHLEAALARGGPPGGAPSVLNAGCPRWTITDQLEQLERVLAAGLRPRVVVLLFCGNDLRELDKDPARERVAEGTGPFTRFRRSLALSEALVVATLRGRRAWLQARGRWPQPMRDDQGRTGDWARPYWPRYGAHLAALAARCRALGAPLLVGAFPGFDELGPGPCELERALPPLVAAAGARWVDLHGPMRAAVAAAGPAEPAGGLFLLPHDPHASPRGNALIAEVFAGPVAEALAAASEAGAGPAGGH